MKVYKLDAIINNEELVHKMFISREKADKYMEKILNKYNLEVDEIIYRDNKHSQEFVCNTYNRISINRVIY